MYSFTQKTQPEHLLLEAVLMYHTAIPLREFYDLSGITEWLGKQSEKASHRLPFVSSLQSEGQGRQCDKS